MALTEAAVHEVVLGWQRSLGLRDWDVRVEVVRKEWRKSGDIKIDACNQLAVLMVNETVAQEFVAEVVLHELVHLRLHDLDRMLEDLLNLLYGDAEGDPRRAFAHGQFMDHLESATQGLTRAMLYLAGNHELMLTPSLAQAVKEEQCEE